jgi:hypothetical protein
MLRLFGVKRGAIEDLCSMGFSPFWDSGARPVSQSPKTIRLKPLPVMEA